MTFPFRSLPRFLFLTIVTVVTPLWAGVPPEWKDADVPNTPPSWYAVEVATFPSSTLALGLQQSLQAQKWGPVDLVERGSETVVLVGETDNIGEAYYLKEELRVQRIVD